MLLGFFGSKVTNSTTESPSACCVEVVEEFVFFEGIDDRRPVPADVALRLRLEVEHELEVDLQDAGVVLGPLDVAAHPEEAVGDAA